MADGDHPDSNKELYPSPTAVTIGTAVGPFYGDQNKIDSPEGLALVHNLSEDLNATTAQDQSGSSGASPLPNAELARFHPQPQAPFGAVAHDSIRGRLHPAIASVPGPLQAPMQSTMDFGAPPGQHSILSPNSNEGSIDRSLKKKKKVSRACDHCRVKKMRCDPSNSPNGVPCIQCTAGGRQCTYLRIPQKRGPNKGYIKDLEKRLETLEGIVRNQNDSGPQSGDDQEDIRRDQEMFRPDYSSSGDGHTSLSAQLQTIPNLDGQQRQPQQSPENGRGDVEQQRGQQASDTHKENRDEHPEQRQNGHQDDRQESQQEGGKGDQQTNGGQGQLEQLQQLPLPLPLHQQIPPIESQLQVKLSDETAELKRATSSLLGQIFSSNLDLSTMLGIPPTTSAQSSQQPQSSSAVDDSEDGTFEPPAKRQRRIQYLFDIDKQVERSQPDPGTPYHIDGPVICESSPYMIAIQSYYEYIHPLYPILPDSESCLRRRLNDVPANLQKAFYEALQSVGEVSKSSWLPSAPSPLPLPQASSGLIVNSSLAAEFLTEYQFGLLSTNSTAIDLVVIWTCIFLAIDADLHGPSGVRSASKPARSFWLGSAIGKAHSMRLYETNALTYVLEKDGSVESDQPLARRTWLVLVALDRWFASSAASPLLISDHRVWLRQDRLLLRSTALTLMRISIILGKLSVFTCPSSDKLMDSSNPSSSAITRLLLDELETAKEDIPMPNQSSSQAAFLSLAAMYTELMIRVLTPTADISVILTCVLAFVHGLTNSENWNTGLLDHYFFSLASLIVLDLVGREGASSPSDGKTRERLVAALNALVDKQLQGQVKFRRKGREVGDCWCDAIVQYVYAHGPTESAIKGQDVQEKRPQQEQQQEQKQKPEQTPVELEDASLAGRIRSGYLWSITGTLK